MTNAVQQRMASGVSPIGLLFVLTTSVGWGLNWPVMKFALSQMPLLSARGCTGVVGAAALALYTLASGVGLKVPRDQWPRLVVSAFLNVTLWVTVMSYALVWLPASEAVVIAYIMPVWTALLAWPLLGERLTLIRVTALVMAFAGFASLFGANGVSASMGKLPGLLLALIGSVGFALGTIFLKKKAYSAAGRDVGNLADRDRQRASHAHRHTRRTSRYRGAIVVRLARSLLHDVCRLLHRLCHLVRRGRASAGLGGGDRHHARADHRGRRLLDHLT